MDLQGRGFDPQSTEALKAGLPATLKQSRQSQLRLGRIRSVENLPASSLSAQPRLLGGSAPPSPTFESRSSSVTPVSPLATSIGAGVLSPDTEKKFQWQVWFPQSVRLSSGRSGVRSETNSRRNSIAPTETDPKLQQLLAERGQLGELRRYSLPSDSLATSKITKVPTPPESREHIKSLPTVKGLDQVCSYPQQGYSREHLEAFCKTIADERGVLGLRPFDSLGTSLVAKGLRSKPKAVAVKSANWGAQASRITRDQSLSKLAGKGLGPIKEAQDISDQLDLPYFQLKLSEQRIAELEAAVIDKETEQKAIENRKILGGGELGFTGSPRGSEEVYNYKLIPDGSGFYDVYIEKDHQFVPVEIYDFIPDYDIAFLSFEIDVTNLGGEHKVTPFVVSDESEHKFHLIKRQESRAADVEVEGYIKQGEEYQKEMDKTLGLASEKLKEYIPRLNGSIGRAKENPMIHHGAAFDYEGTELESCLPMVLVISKPFGAFDEQYYIVKNVSQLRAVIKEMRDNKYFINTSHFDELSHIHGEWFTHYLRKISAMTPEQVRTNL